MPTTKVLVFSNLCSRLQACGFGAFQCNRSMAIPTQKYGVSFLVARSHGQRCQFPTTIRWRNGNSNTKVGVSGSPPPAASAGPPGPWNKWILGIMLTIILPFLSHRWGPLLRFTKGVEAKLETAEELAEAVEKVAEEVEKVAENVENLAEKAATKFPGAAGKIESAAAFVDHVAEKVAKDAHLAEGLIDKVDEVVKDVDTILEPATDEAQEVANETKDTK